VSAAHGVSLGIPGVGGVSPGTHFCALYSGPAERDRLLFPFLEEGLRNGDKCLCLIDDVEPALVRERVLGQPGPGYARRAAQLEVERASDAYLPSGQFSVDDMTSFLEQSMDTAIEADFELFRAAGEMSWVLPGPPGKDDLFRYESGLNRVVQDVPVILMCLYDLGKFGADMLVDVLRTHPVVILDRTVIANPHYVAPQDYERAARRPGSRWAAAETGADSEAGSDRRWASLTAAELRVTSCVARGLTNRAIAEELQVSRHTVDAHLKHVYVKLDIHSRVQLTLLVLQRDPPRG
jgi:DNA-binding CsgD family transcriptional regulator